MAEQTTIQNGNLTQWSRRTTRSIVSSGRSTRADRKTKARTLGAISIWMTLRGRPHLRIIPADFVTRLLTSLIHNSKPTRRTTSTTYLSSINSGMIILRKVRWWRITNANHTKWCSRSIFLQMMIQAVQDYHKLVTKVRSRTFWVGAACIRTCSRVEEVVIALTNSNSSKNCSVNWRICP